MELLGTVVRLQVQRSRLKPARGAPASTTRRRCSRSRRSRSDRGGSSGRRRTARCSTCTTPTTRTAGTSASSTACRCCRARYAALRDRYGDHLVGGAAGESLLLDTPGAWAEADLAGPLLIETADGGLLELSGATAAPPCVEFSRFCLRLPVGPVGPDAEQTLVDLDGGARGFYVSVARYVSAAGAGRVERGARLLHPA